MTKSLSFVLLPVSLLFLVTTGCDFESGGDSNTYNSRYNWVNFSGVYRPTSGTYLVTNFRGTPATTGTPAIPGDPGTSGTPAIPAVPDVTETRTASEQVGTGDGTTTTFSGRVSNNDVAPGTFSVSAAGFTLVDDGAGSLSGSGATGTIVYATGAFSLNFGAFAPDAGSAITASYSYTVVTVPGTPAVPAVPAVPAQPGTPAQPALPATPGGPGSTGFEIFNFNIQHSGEQISIRDSTGRTYTGRMGSIRSTGGQSQDNPGTVAAPVDGEQVIGLYNVQGVSPAGVKVTITGTLQGTVSGGALTGRNIQGTWIEEGGVSGDVSGQAASIPITTTTTTTSQ